jgi:hypothetical protein
MPFAPTTGPLDCDIDCGDNEPLCPDGQHDAWNTVPAFMAWTRNGGVHAFPQDCRAYTCDVRHGPFCGYWPGGLEDLRTSVLAQDAKTIAATTRSDPKEVVVNTERSALQIVNCKGAVVVHIPMSSALVSAVNAARDLATR